MSHQQGDDVDYLEDEHEMEEVDVFIDEFQDIELDGFDSDVNERRGIHLDGFGSDVDEFLDVELSDVESYIDELQETDMNYKIEDISAADVRNGRDIQGIPWERAIITREARRQIRLQEYQNYENIPQSDEISEKECKTTKKDGLYYDFRYNASSVIPTFSHTQLRNMISATSKHDVYLLSHFSLMHWSSLTCVKTEILDLSGHVAPYEKHPESQSEGFTHTEVSTLAVKDKLLVAGGLQGELIVKYLDEPGVCFCSQPTYDDDAITTAIEIKITVSGALHFFASNNDCGVRDFDMETFQLSNHFHLPWPVNHTSVSPDGRLLIVVGDDPGGMLVDSRNGMAFSHLCGHVDYSFASAWHPDGRTFATGNQDKTCRIWDCRNLSKSVTVLKGNLGAIRSISYTSDGRFMAMAESADFVHVFDVKSGYEVEQEIDFFGEISGVSFSPDTESLFIGLRNRTFGSLFEFGRRHNYSYHDAMI
ncbi:hypothetical protein RDI58_019175 [Solanum bulbocastanum]|uniref:WD-repeat protein n=1 Tax=Solanum bulbocastanum TaxID=147425 RepID=A0AAN8TDC3_SOLBU